MKLQYISIDQITFTYTSYREGLYESIQRVGLSFPIKVATQQNGYLCQDGHKRLSILQDLRGEKSKKIPIIVVNDGSTRSNDCWRARNTH